MSLYLITGNSGVGKSTVTLELKNKGFAAYDVDDDGFAKWHNEQTGYIHPKSSVKQEARTPDFLAIHSWKVPRQDIEELAEKAQDKPVFLCGGIDNYDEVKDLFTSVFALVLDDETLKHRLQTRTSNDWGKQPHELERSLQWQHDATERYKKLGFTVIDATQPIDAVIGTVLNKVSEQH